MDLFKEVGGSHGRAYNHIMDKREQLSTWWKTVVQSRASAESAKRHDEASSGVKKYYEIANHAIHNWGHKGCAADGNTENDVADLKANGRASLGLYTSTANCPRDRIRAVVLEHIIGFGFGVDCRPGVSVKRRVRQWSCPDPEQDGSCPWHPQ